VDRLDADGTSVSGQESTNPPTPRPLKKHLIEGSGAEMPIPWGFQAQERPQVQHDHHHARDSAWSRAEHLLRAMAGGKAAVSGPRIAGHCPQWARCERQIRGPL